MTLEDDILAHLGKQMSELIDADVLWSLRVLDAKDRGWHLVNLDRLIDNKHAIDITEWIRNNVKGQYHRNGRHFIFESQKDANWFILRWGVADMSKDIE